MIKPQTIFTGDNLDIMRGMESEGVDLIYLDPPFNSNRFYSAPIGSKAAGAAFKDTWTLSDTDDAWWGEIADEHPSLYKVIDAAGEVGGKGNKAYLIYIAMRLLEMRRILKPTGSIYLHCDPTMSHSLKMMMDSIFGDKNFSREIIWALGAMAGYKSLVNNYVRGHDTLLFYQASEKSTFNKEYLPYDEKQLKRFSKKDDGGRKYKPITKTRRLYLDEAKGIPISDVWKDIFGFQNIVNSKERTGYPTQKPLALLERIVKASSNEGDIVFDPFCGCATTLIAAQKLKRHWIGIDISPVAVRLVKDRLENELGLFAKFIHRTDIPTRKKDIKRSRNIKHVLYGKQEGMCKGCREWYPFRNMTLDHIISKNRGGADDDTNLQLLCNSCNSMKGDRPMEFLVARLKRTGL